MRGHSVDVVIITSIECCITRRRQRVLCADNILKIDMGKGINKIKEFNQP